MGVPYAQLVFHLANFKAFGEVYGFVAASDAFGFAARAIQQVISQIGTPDDFVGVVEDSFVVLTHIQPSAVDAMIRAMQTDFAEGIEVFYSFQDVARGGVMLDNGSNVQELIPLMQLELTV